MEAASAHLPFAVSWISSSQRPEDAGETEKSLLRPCVSLSVLSLADRISRVKGQKWGITHTAGCPVTCCTGAAGACLPTTKKNTLLMGFDSFLLFFLISTCWCWEKWNEPLLLGIISITRPSAVMAEYQGYLATHTHTPPPKVFSHKCCVCFC